MDSTTKWLLRGSAVVVIAVGGTGIFTMLSFLNKSDSETKVTMDIDKIRTTGNKCPASWAYIGGGYCQKIVCTGRILSHDPRLGGKGWDCKRMPKDPMNFFPNNLMLVGESIRATTDERCPLIEPEVGKNNSCQNGLTEKEIKASTGLKSGHL